MNKEELQQYTLNCFEFLGYELFKVKRAYRDMYGSFEEWFEPEDMYIKNPTKEFKEHLILSDPEEVGLDWDVKLFDSYYYPCTDEFYSDWNKIMEVVEAIEEKSKSVIFGESVYDSFNIGKNSIKFYFSPNNKYLLQLELKQFLPDEIWKHNMYKNHIIKQFDFKNKGKKAAVVEAINLFLIWYKQNK